MRKWMLFGVFTFSSLNGVVGSACATELADCYVRAAGIDSFWYRWAAGLDCELDFVECARVKLMGA
jgi:hypothetical protein